ncbi:MAG TPA: ABC transporter ATP-binding protein [Eubacteriaceae bacterium]|jgi:iron complex transport system ATP-binding protein|nr:ABC transporter ATP-binding protein [Eubacteriaceae bacterium]
MEEILKVSNLSFSYPSKNIFSEVSFSLRKGEIICLMGPNGCGKTTLLDNIMAILHYDKGEITLMGKPIYNYKRREIAQNIAYVPQIHNVVFPYTVEQVVMMGRTAHLGYFGEPGPKDIEYCNKAIEKVGISHLAKKPYSQLSGGEVKLVLLARALSQNSPLIVMDEPTTNLDFKNILLFLETIVDLSKKENISILMATHSPEHAFFFQSKGIVVKAALMSNGIIKDFGEPEKVISEENIKTVYGVNAKINTEYTENNHKIRSITLLGTI